MNPADAIQELCKCGSFDNHHPLWCWNVTFEALSEAINSQ